MDRAESKYSNTARRMDRAFLDLLDRKDFAYITVKELCQAAGVNRSTFYLHYETMGDLLSESVEAIMSEFLDYMQRDTGEFIRKLWDCPREELYLITPEYLTPYLSFIFRLSGNISGSCRRPWPMRPRWDWKTAMPAYCAM